MKLIASIGDAHTSIYSSNYNGTSIYPIKFEWFKEGLIVNCADSDHQQYIGKKLLSIGNTNIMTIYDSIKTIIPHENEAWAKYQSGTYFSRPSLLKFLNCITNIGEINFNFENAGTVTITPIPTMLIESYNCSNESFKNNIPLYLQNTDLNYWCSYLENDHILFIQYNKCAEIPSYPFSRFTQDVLSILDNDPVDKCIVDLRFNSGGNSTIFTPLLNEIKYEYSINQPGKLFTIIGKKTFSSGLMNAIDMKTKTNSLLIGEPTGGKPNHYGEVRNFHLPYSGITVYYSTKYFNNFTQDNPSLYPDINVELSYSDYVLGIDPVMNVIKEY